MEDFNRIRSVIFVLLRSKSFIQISDEANKFIMSFQNEIISTDTLKESFNFFEMIKFNTFGKILPSIKRDVCGSAYSRQLRQTQPNTPYEISIKFRLTNEQPKKEILQIFVSIQIIPFLYKQIHRDPFNKRLLLESSDLTTINQVSFSLCEEIGAAIHGNFIKHSSSQLDKNNIIIDIPPDISLSLQKFRSDYPEQEKVGFIIMKFGKTDIHDTISTVVKKILSNNGLIGIRADDKDYHTDKFPNILTYLYGCGFGIAIFENIISSDFNPNVSLEVGSLLALNKPVCLLKDNPSTIAPDIDGRIYKEFNSDPEYCERTILKELTNWLIDNKIIEKS